MLYIKVRRENRVKSERTIGGLILIFIGIFWILTNFGIITWSLFGVMFRLWPLILIVIGINVIFRDRVWVSYITWGLFFIIIILFGFYEQYSFRNDVFLNSNSDLVIENTLETTTGKLKLRLGGGSIRIDSTNDKLIDANVPVDKVRKDVRFSKDNTEVYIDIKQKSDFIKLDGKKAYDYDLNLNEDILWDIDIDMGAINSIMDFSNLRVESLDIDTGASNLNLIFGDREKHTEIDLDGAASKVEITVPENIGVKVDFDGFLKDTNIEELGWTEMDSYYVSPNYEEAVNKLDIHLDMAVGRFEVKVK